MSKRLINEITTRINRRQYRLADLADRRDHWEWTGTINARKLAWADFEEKRIKDQIAILEEQLSVAKGEDK